MHTWSTKTDTCQQTQWLLSSGTFANACVVIAVFLLYVSSLTLGLVQLHGSNADRFITQVLQYLSGLKSSWWSPVMPGNAQCHEITYARDGTGSECTPDKKQKHVNKRVQCAWWSKERVHIWLQTENSQRIHSMCEMNEAGSECTPDQQKQTTTAILSGTQR